MKIALTSLVLLVLSGCTTIAQEQWEQALRAVAATALQEAQALNDQQRGSK